MDDFRTHVKAQVVAANRGPFGGWWQALLDADPELLRRVHVYLEVAEESGPIPEVLRHLIWAAVDGVVTHLYPRGLGVHAAIAVEHGASISQVLDVFRIATIVSSRGYGIGLPLLLEEVERAGAARLPDADAASTQVVHDRLERELGQWPAWMNIEARLAPGALAAFLDLAPDDEVEDGLDPKARELVYVGAASCPAIADGDLTRTHMRRALELGATPAELLQTLRLANAIGLHSISEGVMQLQEHGLTAK